MPEEPRLPNAWEKILYRSPQIQPELSADVQIIVSELLKIEQFIDTIIQLGGHKRWKTLLSLAPENTAHRESQTPQIRLLRIVHNDRVIGLLAKLKEKDPKQAKKYAKILSKTTLAQRYINEATAPQGEIEITHDRKSYRPIIQDLINWLRSWKKTPKNNSVTAIVKKA
jgi:hypothetical protein